MCGKYGRIEPVIGSVLATEPDRRDMSHRDVCTGRFWLGKIRKELLGQEQARLYSSGPSNLRQVKATMTGATNSPLTRFIGEGGFLYAAIIE